MKIKLRRSLIEKKLVQEFIDIHMYIWPALIMATTFHAA